MSQSQAVFLSVCFMCSSKGHASWLWLVVFGPYIFCSWETFTHDANLCRCKFSQFALTFRSGWYFGFWKDGIKWLVLVCGKDSFFRGIQREKWRFLKEERANDSWNVNMKHDSHILLYTGETSLLCFKNKIWLRMSIKGNWCRHGSQVVIHWCERFFSCRFMTWLCHSILRPQRGKNFWPRG